MDMAVSIAKNCVCASLLQLQRRKTQRSSIKSRSRFSFIDDRLTREIFLDIPINNNIIDFFYIQACERKDFLIFCA